MWERSVLVGGWVCEGAGPDDEEEEEDGGGGGGVCSVSWREAKRFRREVESPASVQKDMYRSAILA